MKLRRLFAGVSLGSAIACGPVCAQTPAAMSLMEAQQIALRNHPRIASAELAAQAVGFTVKQVRSAYYPTVSGNLTGVGTEHDSVLSAGAVTTSSIYSRQASGVVANQLLTDFGRTASLEQSAKLHTASQNRSVMNTRAQLLVEVQQTYYRALASESILRVARATLDLRRVTLRQVSALAQSSLRSTVDVSFAKVNESQAELDLFRAENDATASHVRLSAAMGYDHDQPFVLSDEPLPSPLDPNVDALIEQAERERPDLAALQLNRLALDGYADAERRLRNPTLTVAAVAGVAPVRDDRLPETYSAAGVTLNIPVLNGGLFKARREEAESRAAAAAKDVQDLSIQIARDVRVAWLDANDSFRRLDVTARMVAQANEALRLAQARYDNALGSIVELNQAQLNQTSAEIAGRVSKIRLPERSFCARLCNGEPTMSHVTRKQRRILLIMVASGLLVATTSCARNGGAETTPIAVDIPTVAVVQATRADLSRNLILTAEFEPFQEIDVMAKVSGYIKQINVDIGDRVKEGQLLATLEIPEMQDDLTRAAAAIEEANAELATALDELQRAQSAHDMTHLSYSRILDVSKREVGLVPQQEVDEVHSRDLVAEAQVAGAKSHITACEQRIRVAQAEQARVKTLFQYAVITAPFAGVVTKRYANTGSLIQAGTTSQTQAMPVVRLSQNGLLRLALPVPESAVPMIHLGEPVDVRVSAMNRTFPGRVARFADKVDQSTRTMKTEVDVTNSTLLLIPGMYAEVDLTTEQRKNVLTVPMEAVDGSGDSARLFTVKPSGTIQVVPVGLGIENAQRIEVRSGDLKEGDRVVVGSRAGLKAGSKVQPKVIILGVGSASKS